MIKVTLSQKTCCIVKMSFVVLTASISVNCFQGGITHVLILHVLCAASVSSSHHNHHHCQYGVPYSQYRKIIDYDFNWPILRSSRFTRLYLSNYKDRQTDSTDRQTDSSWHTCAEPCRWRPLGGEVCFCLIFSSSDTDTERVLVPTWTLCCANCAVRYAQRSFRYEYDSCRCVSTLASPAASDVIG